MDERVSFRPLWLRLEDGKLVNLAQFESIGIQEPSYKANKCLVALYRTGPYEPLIACRGSVQKCRDYMRNLGYLLDAQGIRAYETHPCECGCGCKNRVIEGFHICDECEAGGHVS